MQFAVLFLCVVLFSSDVLAGIKKDNCNCGCNCENRVTVKFSKPRTAPALPERPAPTIELTCPEDYHTLSYGDGMKTCYKQIALGRSGDERLSYEMATRKCSEEADGYLAMLETNDEYFALEEWFTHANLPVSFFHPSLGAFTYALMGGHRIIEGGTWRGGPDNAAYENLPNIPELGETGPEENCQAVILAVSEDLPADEGEEQFGFGSAICEDFFEGVFGDGALVVYAMCETDLQ